MSHPGPSGLSPAEALDRLKIHGRNEIPGAGSRGVLGILKTALAEPMILLLVGCASIYFIMGETQDGMILAFSVGIVLSITLYQEWRSERAIEALRDLSSPRALVIRGGRETRIAGAEVVPGDWVVVSEGDRIPADAELMESTHLQVDESLLTGEALSVSKGPRSQLFAGTLVVAGRGIALVGATGPRTQMGRIGQSLQARKPEDRTLLQTELGRLIRVFGVLSLFFSLLVVVTYGLTRGDWAQGLLLGLAAAMSLLPEEFPVVLTVFLAMGAWRISKAHVLTRRISSTESLGSITVLCVDKTGTLTRNQMEVRALDTDGRAVSLEGERLTDAHRALLETAALACPTRPFDPMEKAILRAFESSAGEPAGLGRGWRLTREYGLSHELLAMTCVWSAPGPGPSVIATKGAPEAVLSLCGEGGRGAEARAILARVQVLADQGLRVLGVARATHGGGPPLPEQVREYAFEFLGLVGLEDPVRDEVPGALRECYEAGVRVIMMTGDYAGTARSVARRIGFGSAENVLLGAELRGFSDSELSERVQSTDVFARMVPEQKLRVIQALKGRGEIVAMTGDGVNDAPSLKWADVGIAMGGRGTDVAREAAAMVLLDDNFASIVAAIRLGRTIFDNLRKAVAYVFAVHVPIAGMVLLPVLLGMPPVLLPAHIVFLELVIDPASALLFEGEPAEPDVMRRPPRSLGKPLFSLGEIARNTLQGALALVAVFGAYRFAWSGEQDEGLARSVAFAALVLSNLSLILVNRSRSAGLRQILRTRNPIFVWLGLGTLLVLALVLSWPAARSVFRFGALDLRGVALALMSGVATLVAAWCLKRVWPSAEAGWPAAPSRASRPGP